MSEEQVVESTDIVKPVEVKIDKAENIEKLKDSDIRWRAKYKGAKEELETLKVQADKEVKELASRAETVVKEKAMYESKYIEAELKAQAVAAGIKDVDLVNLIDKSQLKITESGAIEGLEAAINDFKTKKPDFFGIDRKVSSSSNAVIPSVNTPQVRNAWDLSPEEWKKNLPNYRRGRIA